MHIKRFEAATMREAVEQVKQELGPDALVLSTRTVRKEEGLFGLFGRSIVEVTAAVDRDASRHRPAGESRSERVTQIRDGLKSSSGSSAGDRTRAQSRASHGDEVSPHSSWKQLAISRAVVDPLEKEIRELRRELQALAGPRASEEAMSRELAEIRRFIACLSQEGRSRRDESEDGRFVARLLEAGIAVQHACRLGEHALVASAQSGEERLQALRRVLAKELDIHLLPLREDDAPRSTLFVGPTGVGKTTTLAKIAAREVRLGADVAILTTDTFRIGAEEQLRTYARLLGTPFGVAVSSEDLGRQVARQKAKRLFIDTAGRSRRDIEALPELVRCRATLGRSARVYLVLSATTKESDVREQIRRYRVLEPDAIIFTKLDESENAGSLVNLLLEDETPQLAWLTTGQRVPEDLEVPDPGELAARVLKGDA